MGGHHEASSSQYWPGFFLTPILPIPRPTRPPREVRQARPSRLPPAAQAAPRRRPPRLARPATPAPATGMPSAAMPKSTSVPCSDLQSKNPQTLNWETSIVDLMKLLGLDSSLAARKSLASELGYGGDVEDSAAMNVWLHKQDHDQAGGKWRKGAGRAEALTQKESPLTEKPHRKVGGLGIPWWRIPDSNRGPADYDSVALTG